MGSRLMKEIMQQKRDALQLTKAERVDGRYITPWGGSRPTTLQGVRWILEKKNRGIGGTWKEMFRYKTQELNQNLPVLPIDQELVGAPKENAVQVTWLGHATLLVQLQGLNILTDPNMNDFAGPTRLLSKKRYRPAPCDINELPEIDAVCVSHNHYDHLDYSTVVHLNKRFGNTVYWYVPMGLGNWLQDCGCVNTIELEWWDESIHPKHEDGTEGVKFVCCPSQHWSSRNLRDENKSLWGSWCVVGSERRFFFAGDTGYNKVFQEIGEMYGPFDLAAIPIGAYKPRWFLHFQHVDPSEAVQIHQDVKSKTSVGIHWGTFPLGFEHYLDPPKDLKTALQEKELDVSSFVVMNHGESRIIEHVDVTI